MRIPTLTVLVTGLVAACVGETGGSRKPGAGSSADKPTGECAQVTKDVTIRSAADMKQLPRSGCYDLRGKLVVQGQAITSLAELGEIHAVDDLDLDHTAIAAIDTKRTLGIYGKLTLTGNSKLANLRQLAFQAASTGILIDGNPALATLDVLALDDPKLTEVDGDVVITGNAALTALPLKNLSRVTGAVEISNNAVLRVVDLSNLGSVGSVELADNPQLGSLTGLGARTIAGDLAIRNNAALTSLGTMPALYRVTGNVTIDHNAALTRLTAFTTSLAFIDQSLTITGNAALTDLGSLKHLQLVGAITISGNQNLLICRAIEIDACVPHPYAAVVANNKDVSCNWQCE